MLTLTGKIKFIEDNERNQMTVGIKIQQTGTSQMLKVTVNKEAVKQFPIGEGVTIQISTIPGEGK